MSSPSVRAGEALRADKNWIWTRQYVTNPETGCVADPHSIEIIRDITRRDLPELEEALRQMRRWEREWDEHDRWFESLVLGMRHLHAILDGAYEWTRLR